jgi:hypothetical protein
LGGGGHSATGQPPGLDFHLKKSLAVTGLLAGLWISPAIASSTTGASDTTAKYLCLIVLDGGRPDYIKHNIGHMPNLARMIRNGRMYDRAWVGDLASVTPVSHAVLGTGSLPRNDGGMVNWDWGDTQTGKTSRTLQDIRNFQNGWAFRLMERSGTPTLSKEIRAKYPKGLVVAGGGWHFHGEALLGGPSASWIYYYKVGSNRYFAPFTLGPHPVPRRLLQDRSLQVHEAKSTGSSVPVVSDPVHIGDQDRLALKFAGKTLRLYRPRALMVNVPEPDIVGHHTLHWGHDERILYRSFDRDLGNLLKEYRRARILDQTLFVVVSDHGMMQTNHRFLSRPAVETVMKAQHATPELFNGGGAAGPTMNAIWITKRALSQRVGTAVARRHFTNASAVFYLRRQSSQYLYHMAACYGCSQSLVRAYRYLVSTMSGPNGPDIVILLRENARTSGFNGMPGRHGGADWASQHITLLLSGPGVKTGTSHHPARLVDMAPTIERLMGIAPNARDGLVLADAFQRPDPRDLARQTASDPTLTWYVDAIVARAHADTVMEARQAKRQAAESREVQAHGAAGATKAKAIVGFAAVVLLFPLAALLFRRRNPGAAS